MKNEKCPKSAIQEVNSEQCIRKCKLCPDSVQGEGQVGLDGMDGMNRMDRKLGWVKS